MICQACGHANGEGALFCSRCGVAAQPAAKEAGATPAATAFDEAAWKAVIGPNNQAYYLARFARLHQTGQGGLWHWPAFFATSYWLLYRKMWLWAAVYFFAPSVLALAVAAVATLLPAGGWYEGAVWAVYLALLLLAPPLWANRLYYQHALALMEDLRPQANGREQFLARLEAHGGTSRVVLMLLGVFLAIALLGVLAAIALPAYSDYTKRAKFAEALVSGMSVAQKVGAHIEAHGALPDVLDQTMQPSPASKHLSDVELDPVTGKLTLHIQLSKTQTGTAELEPSQDSAGRISWACSSPDAAKFAPASCRP